jgi:hypothetical protein
MVFITSAVGAESHSGVIVRKCRIEDFLLLAMYSNVYRTVSSYVAFVLDIVQGFWVCFKHSVSETVSVLSSFLLGGWGGGWWFRWMELVLLDDGWNRSIFQNMGFERNLRRWNVFKVSCFLLQHGIVTTVGRTARLHCRFKPTLFFCFWHCYIWCINKREHEEDRRRTGWKV